MRRLALTLTLPLLGCARPKQADAPADGALPLIWARGYEGDTLERSLEGLWWQLSLLGASPPADGRAVEIVEEEADRARLLLDPQAAGFDEAGLAAMEEAVAGLAESDEARLFGGVDLGRALMRTLYSPWRYYAITGACRTLEGWRAARSREPLGAFAVNDSLLVAGEREIALNLDPAGWAEVAMEAAEGEGSLHDGSFAALEHETLDLMSNGQQRFAVYDVDGEILPAATASAAGQPGRCMWCHEGDMQVLSPGNTPVDGYLTPEEFLAQLSLADAALATRRAELESAVDWAEPEVHAWGELLVETFLAPSPGRLAREWGVEVEEVEAKLEALGLTLRESEEYPEQGPLYARAELDARMDALLPWILERSALPLGEVDGWAAIEVLPSARELDPAAHAGLEGEELAAELPSCGVEP